MTAAVLGKAALDVARSAPLRVPGPRPLDPAAVRAAMERVSAWNTSLTA